MGRKKVWGHMSAEDRAKQFMPFAALKGYEQALREKERIIVPKAELSDEYKEELDDKLRKVQEKDIITITYFCKDEYIQATGMVSKLDSIERVLQVVDTEIAFDDVYSIKLKR